MGKVRIYEHLIYEALMGAEINGISWYLAIKLSIHKLCRAAKKIKGGGETEARKSPSESAPDCMYCHDIKYNKAPKFRLF